MPEACGVAHFECKCSFNNAPVYPTLHPTFSLKHPYRSRYTPGQYQVSCRNVTVPGGSWAQAATSPSLSSVHVVVYCTSQETMLQPCDEPVIQLKARTPETAVSMQVHKTTRPADVRSGCVRMSQTSVDASPGLPCWALGAGLTLLFNTCWWSGTNKGM